MTPDAKTIEVLCEALDDEYRARATYQKVIDTFGPVRPFVNIVEAEDRHAQALLSLFARFGVPCAAEHAVTTLAEAQTAVQALGGRVVLKVLSAEITHKSDVGGVALGVTPDTLGERMDAMVTELTQHTGKVGDLPVSVHALLPKLITHHKDGTETTVTPLPMWQP